MRKQLYNETTILHFYRFELLNPQKSQRKFKLQNVRERFLPDGIYRKLEYDPHRRRIRIPCNYEYLPHQSAVVLQKQSRCLACSCPGFDLQQGGSGSTKHREKCGQLLVGRGDPDLEIQQRLRDSMYLTLPDRIIPTGITNFLTLRLL